MTQIATQLAKNFLRDTPSNLYINVEHLDSDIIHATFRYQGEKFKDVSMIDMMFRDKTKPVQNQKLSGEVFAKFAKSNPEASKGSCRDAYVIEYAIVNIPGGGYGRLLYYVVMHYAASHGITADRVKSSSDAVGTWNKLWNDSEVQKLPLDDFFDPKTPDPNDDCNLASSGIYPQGKEHGEKAEHSKKAHDWNPYLKGHEGDDSDDSEEYEKDPVLKQEKAEQYKKQKASKLNYVYVAESRQAINILNDAGRLAYNGKFAPKPTKTVSSIVGRNVPKPLEENHVLIYNLLFGD
jgi:hypothetical protein